MRRRARRVCSKNQAGPSDGRIANAVADGEDAGDGDETGRGVEEGGVGGEEVETSD